MKRLPIALLSVLALAGFTEAGGKFSIEFPRGWSDPLVTTKDGTVQSTDPESDGKIYCRANSVPLAAIKDRSQSELNGDYAAPLDHATWAGFLSVDAAQFSESEGKARIVAGHIVQEATLTATAELMGRESKIRIAAHILPGRAVNVLCFAPSGDFNARREQFDAVLASFKPL